MECKLTILMRALLAVALVAITLVLTYATANPPWMCRKSACRRLSVGIPHSTKDTKHVSGLPYQRICQPYPHVIRQANDCLPESCSRNPLAAGLPQQETRMSFNRRAANLTRGGIEMKSIQTKFIVLILGCILLSSSMIGGAGILNAKHVVDEDSVKIMNLMCKEKTGNQCAVSRIQQSVKTLAVYPPLRSRIYAADIRLVLKQNDA